MKTSELTGTALDWAVAKCDGLPDTEYSRTHMDAWPYSTDWSQGGPIIEREGLCLIKTGTVWLCTTNGNELHSHAKEGQTPLIAAMRCYVASKLGDEIEIPEELT